MSPRLFLALVAIYALGMLAGVAMSSVASRADLERVEALATIRARLP